MAAVEPRSQSRRDMQRYVEQHIPEQLFRDGRLHNVELKYKDINLELYIKNNKCTISSFSRGHYVRENPMNQQLHRAAFEHEEASDKGDGALFLATVVVHCNLLVGNLEWNANNLTEWASRIGICTPQTCRQTDSINYVIDTDHIVTWANTVLGTRGGKKRYKQSKQNRKQKLKKTKRKY